jgi:hypothetical protein
MFKNYKVGLDDESIKEKQDEVAELIEYFAEPPENLRWMERHEELVEDLTQAVRRWSQASGSRAREKELVPEIDTVLALVNKVSDVYPGDLGNGMHNAGTLIAELGRLALVIPVPDAKKPELGKTILDALLRCRRIPDMGARVFSDLRAPGLLDRQSLPAAVGLLDRAAREADLVRPAGDLYNPALSDPGTYLARCVLRDLLPQFPDLMDEIVEMVTAKSWGEHELLAFVRTLELFEKDEIAETAPLSERLLQRLHAAAPEHVRARLVALQEALGFERQAVPGNEVIVGTVVSEPADGALFPAADDVFAASVPDEARERFLPVVSLELSHVDPAWKGTAHFLYHEMDGPRSISFMADEAGRITQIEADRPMAALPSRTQWEDPGAYDATVAKYRGQRVKLERIQGSSRPEPRRDDFDSIADWETEIELWLDDLVPWEAVSDKPLVRFPRPYWVQTSAEIPEAGGEPMRYVGRLVASELGLCDITFFLFADAEGRSFFQVAQST